jgi:hypothetical protein
LGSAAKVLSSFSAFADGVGDAFAFDPVFHLRESGHDREQHRPHGCGGVDVAPAEVQDPQACASTAEFVSEGKHVLHGSAEPVQRSDDEGVAIDQRAECPIELAPRSSRPRHTVINIEVIMSDAGGQEICLLPISFVMGCSEVSHK